MNGILVFIIDGFLCTNSGWMNQNLINKRLFYHKNDIYFNSVSQNYFLDNEYTFWDSWCNWAFNESEATLAKYLIDFVRTKSSFSDKDETCSNKNSVPQYSNSKRVPTKEKISNNFLEIPHWLFHFYHHSNQSGRIVLKMRSKFCKRKNWRVSKGVQL